MTDRNGEQIKENDILQYVYCGFLSVIVTNICQGRHSYIDIRHLCSDRNANISEEALSKDWEILML